MVADSKKPADCLMIVSRGLVEMCLPVKEGGQILSILRRGYERYKFDSALKIEGKCVRGRLEVATG